MRRANGEVWIPATWLRQIVEPIAVTFVEGDYLYERGFVPGDTLICDMAANPEVGEVVAIRDHRPSPRGERNSWGGYPVDEVVAVGVYQGIEHGGPRVHAQVDGNQHQSGWNPSYWQEALIGVYRKTIGSDLRGTPLIDDTEEEAEQAATAARAGS